MTDTLDKPKFCRDCRWIGTNGSMDATKFRCFSPANKDGYNLVTGDDLLIFATAADARDYVGDEGCGKDALWFEVKPAVVYNPGEKIPVAAWEMKEIVKAPMSARTQALVEAAKKRVAKVDPNKIVEL